MSFIFSLEKLWGLRRPHLWSVQVTPAGIIPDDSCSQRKRQPQPKVCRSRCEEHQQAYIELYSHPSIPCQSPTPTWQLDCQPQNGFIPVRNRAEI